MSNSLVTIYLHTDTRDVWGFHADGPRGESHVSTIPEVVCQLESLATYLATAGSGTFRVEASPGNAELIAMFAESANPTQVLELHRPLHSLVTSDLGARSAITPSRLLVDLHLASGDAALSPSLGGWHRTVPGESVAYAIRSRRVPLSESPCSQHPTWNAMSFIPHLDRTVLSGLLALILDPRWHIDLDNPNRSSRLQCFLGLVKSRRPTTIKQSRRFVVDSAWSPKVPPLSQVTEPGQFLWRYWHRATGSDEERNLATSLLFLRYLRDTWLDAVCVGRSSFGVNVGAQGLFIPDHYFTDPRDARAFTEHLRGRTT